MEEVNNLPEEEPLVQPLLKEVVLPSVVIIGIILAGALSGYFLTKPGGLPLRSSGGTAGFLGKSGLPAAQAEMGIKDEEKFPDKAEGRIKINDNPDVPDGSHQLLRPGGPSQTAYLTSAVVDLNLFLDKCVEVMGQTFSSQRAGWFLDVGWIKEIGQCPEGI